MPGKAFFSSTLPILLRPRHQRTLTILPKKQTTCSECGEPIRVYFSATRNPHSRHVVKGIQGVPKKHHDLCAKDFKRLLKMKKLEKQILDMTTTHGGMA